MALASPFFGRSTMLILAVLKIMLHCNSRSSPCQERKGVSAMHLYDDLFLLLSDLLVAMFTWWLNHLDK